MIRWLIIDGYNLIRRAGDHRTGVPTLRACPPAQARPGSSAREVGVPRDLDSQRRHLIQLLEKTIGILAERITVVFDGRSGGNGHSSEGPDEQVSPVVEVLFSPQNKTADTVIEQLAFQAGPKGKVVVVTSDRLERETTEASGAETMACSVFLDQLSETLVRIEQELRSRNAAQHPATPIGNPFSGLDINKPDGSSKV
jgi:predicted RNA-binding protein with PIN domain